MIEPPSAPSMLRRWITLLVIILVMLGIAWIGMFVQVNRMLHNSTKQSQQALFQEASNTAYIYFLKMDEQANMWVGLKGILSPYLKQITLQQVQKDENIAFQATHQVVSLAVSPKEKQLTDHLLSHFTTYDQYFQQAKKVDAIHPEQAQQAILYQNSAISKLLNQQFQSIVAYANQQVEQDQWTGYRVFLGILVVMAIGSLALMMLLIGYVMRLQFHLRTLRDYLQLMGEGTLSNPIRRRRRKSELSELVATTEDVAKRLYYVDPVTQLPNRIALSEELTRQIEVHQSSPDKRALILYFGVDVSSWLSAIYDQVAVQSLWRKVSTRLQDNLGDSISLFRMNEQEWVAICLDHEGEASIVPKVEALLSSFRQPFTEGESEIRMSLQVGIHRERWVNTTVAELLQNAYAAYRRAARKGKNTYVLSGPEMSEATRRSLLLQNDIYRATEQKEWEIYYQPKINISTNQMVGAEALLRWQHPKWGLILPDEFIPMAEESEVILGMGEWVLREVCRQSKRWKVLGYPSLPISVNVSARQLMQIQFVEQVVAILREEEVDPQHLHLEITESMIFDDDDVVLAKLQVFQQQGIAIELDDFGKGYSSLQRLAQLGCEVLKVDQSLIQPIGRNKATMIMVDTLIRLAHQLKMRVVAEGVEEESQRKALRALGCDEYQGYLYSPPLPVTEFEALWKRSVSFP